MKSFSSSRSVIMASAFMFDGLTRSEQISSDLDTHATIMASQMPAYMRLRPDDAPRLTFLLLGHFKLGSPQHADLARFLFEETSPNTVRPMAKAAIESLYQGPKRPNRAANECADFLSRHLDALRDASPATADLAADALVMHSDARPLRKEVAAEAKSDTIWDVAKSDLPNAAEQAALVVVSAGSKSTHSTRTILSFQVNILPQLSAESLSAERDTHMLALYYARRGSKGHHWAEDSLLPQMKAVSKTSIPAAVDVAWHLFQAGDPGRDPSRAGARLLASFNDSLPRKNSDITELLGTSPSMREQRVEAVRKLQRDRLRTFQVEKVPQALQSQQTLVDVLPAGVTSFRPVLN